MALAGQGQRRKTGMPNSTCASLGVCVCEHTEHTELSSFTTLAAWQHSTTTHCI